MITFKQFLIESEPLPDWANKYPRYTPEEIAKLPTVNGGNVESEFRVGNVAFNQSRGVGAIPYNQEVMYNGFVAMMLPQHFQLFTKPKEDSNARVMQQMALIKAGVSIGSPWIWLDLSGEESKRTGLFYVEGHEGRARAEALANIQPNVEIPVCITIYGGNAKSITPDIIQKLNTSIVKEGTQSTVVRDKINSIWVNRSHISLK